ncbi:efflux RND transporter permease subunit [Rosistilla oblonga]|uniref:efflux RND transporter permease subunit n=1 Tax=Rosistilla oblonga TaxID=2527990 RepID=UPI003A96E370
MRIWARLTVGRPVLFLCIVLAVTVGCGMGLLRLRFDTSPNAVFSSNDRSSHQLSDLHEVFGPDDNDLLLMIEGDRLLEPQSIDRLRALRDQLQSLDDVAGVASVFDLRRGGAMLPLLPEAIPLGWDAEKIRHDLTSHPSAAGQLISDSGELMVFWVLLKGSDLTQSQIGSAIAPIDTVIEGFETDSGLRVWKAGHPAIRDGVLSSIQGSLFYGSAFAMIAGMTASLLLFRGLAPVGVCMLGPTLGSIWTFGLMGWCGVAVGGLTSSLPSLIFVIGLTDAIHLLLAANRRLAAGHTRRRAIYASLLRVGPACLLTSLTTMIGFGSLQLSRLDAVAEFGLWAGIGAAAALIADLCVLPLAIRFLPESHLHSRRGSSVPWMEGMMAAVSRMPLRIPIRVSLLGIVAFFAMLPFAIDQKVDIRWTEAIPEADETNEALRLADAELGGALPVLIIIRWPETLSFPASEINVVAGRVSKAVKETTGFAPPASIYNTLAGFPGRSWEEKYQLIEGRRGAVGRIFNPDQRQMLVSTRVPNDGAIALEERLLRLDAKLEPIMATHPDFEIEVTGTVVAAAQNMRAVIGDLARSLSVASVLIFAVMSIQFRSLLIGLISFIPNMLPLLITAAGLSILGYPLQITSALTFSLCLGLAVDDTIHVITHFQQDRRPTRSVAESVRITMLRVGPALLLTTGILVAGFGSMLLNPMPAIKLFSALCCITMIAALIGDLILLPALLMVAFRKRAPLRWPRHAMVPTR